MNPTLTRNLFTALALLPTLVWGQAEQISTSVNSLGQTITVLKATRFIKTPPMRDWPEAEEAEDRDRHEMGDRGRRERPTLVSPQFDNEPDAALQTNPPTRRLRAPIVSWNGQQGSGVPNDPTGAAGPEHYVQAVNTAYRVYSKTGQTIGPAHNLNFLWPGSDNAGDPIVLYDRHADRWFISQFNFGPNRMLLAVSETSDPTGAYYAYEFTFTSFPDYPKFSIWWDGYYMTSNSNKSAVVFERDLMLVGDPDARMIALTAPNPINVGFTCVMPADADGDLPPNGTPCYFFNLEDNAWGAPSDRIKIYEMNTNWVNTGSTQVSQSQTLTVAAFDGWLGTIGSWENIPQPNVTQKLDAGFGFFYFRAQHTRWVDHSSVVLCHGVQVGTSQCGIRWYELRDANDGNWTVYQQGTWAPDGVDRWYGSIGMDAEGNIGMGYSVADADNDLYAGLRYTGRLAGDPLGEMTQWEANVINGSGSQQGSERYGDYAHLSLDPDGQTFWYTGEYLGTGGGARSRIFSFDLFPVGVEEANPYYTSTAFHASCNGGWLNVSIEGLPSDEAITFDVIGSDGRAVVQQQAQPTGNKWSTRTDVRALAPGLYFARLGNRNFQKVERFTINATE